LIDGLIDYESRKDKTMAINCTGCKFQEPQKYDGEPGFCWMFQMEPDECCYSLKRYWVFWTDEDHPGDGCVEVMARNREEAFLEAEKKLNEMALDGSGPTNWSYEYDPTTQCPRFLLPVDEVGDSDSK
jgi:hypothetical protein